MTPLEGCELESYRCSKCRTHGVRLFRQYQTFADSIGLLCQACALVDQGKTEPTQGGSSIGWLVAAVPCPPVKVFGEMQGQSFWGFTSVPQYGCDWWYALPIARPRPEESQ